MEERRGEEYAKEVTSGILDIKPGDKGTEQQEEQEESSESNDIK